MTINIQNASTVNVVGHRTGKNRKPLYDIDEALFYASVTDYAEVHGVTVGSVSTALNNDGATCKGHRICFVSRIMERLDVINETNRIRNEKVAAYDAIIAERDAKAKAQEARVKHQANIDALRRKLEAEMQLLQEAEELCNS